jgi:hypothetical protein
MEAHEPAGEAATGTSQPHHAGEQTRGERTDPSHSTDAREEWADDEDETGDDGEGWQLPGRWMEGECLRFLLQAVSWALLGR